MAKTSKRLKNKQAHRGKCKPFPREWSPTAGMPPENRPPVGDPWPDQTVGGPQASHPAFEAPWMGPFVAEALRTADVPSALGKLKIGWGDYTRSRRTSPAFAAACQEVDLVVKLALWTILESKAATGDARSIKLLAGGLDAIKAQLQSAGLGDLSALPDPDEDIPFVRFGRFALPAGPCAACARGLVIRDTREPSGQSQHVVVRHIYMLKPFDSEEWVDILPYAGSEEHRDHRGLKVLYGTPVGDDLAELAEPPLHVMEHVQDWGLDPRFCLPEPSSPSREELRVLWAKHWENHPVKKFVPVGSNEPDPNEPYFLPIDFSEGETPPQDTAHCYFQDIRADGNGLIWRMKPEFRGKQYHPKAKGFTDAG